MKIIKKTIPHKYQDCDECGDWRQLGDILLIKVSELGNPYMEALVGLHEEIEALLCKRRGISEASVNKWDIEHLNSDNPGGISQAPYHKEHQFAERIERMIAKELKISWKKYGKKVENL